MKWSGGKDIMSGFSGFVGLHGLRTCWQIETQKGRAASTNSFLTSKLSDPKMPTREERDLRKSSKN
jgi:hypothetical protein